MPRIIWKFPLGVTATTIEVGSDPHVVHVGLDPEGVPCVWVEHVVGPEDDLRPVYFYTVGTGWNMPEGWVHVGSFVDGNFVWHLYKTA